MSAFTMYKARGDSHIKPVTVVKKTAKFVTLPATSVGDFKRAERREAISTSYERYFDTHDEALEYLIEKAREKMERLKRATHAANSLLGHLMSQRAKPSRAEGEGSKAGDGGDTKGGAT